MPRFRLGVLSREGSRPSFGTKSHGSISWVRGRHAREILRCTIYIDSRATRTTRYCHGKMRRKEISIIARGEPIDIHRWNSHGSVCSNDVCSKSGCVWSEANNPGNNTDRSKNDGRLIKNLRFPFLYRS